jgi:exopolysaccharide biosynthesis polyprenyl glycosylphosphotransferase
VKPVLIGVARLFSGWTPPALAAVFAAVPWYGTSAPSALAALTWIGGVCAVLLLVRAAARGLRQSGALRERVLVIGDGPLIDKLIDELTHARQRDYLVVGVIDGHRAASRVLAGASGEEAVHRIDRLIAETQPARIVIALGGRRGRLPEQPFLDCRLRGIAVEEAVAFYERVTGKIAIEALTPRALILSDGFRHSDFVPSDVSMAVSRAVSFVCAGLGLIGLAPLMTLIAVAIKLETPGPVFFSQDRVGRGGRAFRLVKFRTMRQGTGAHSEWVRDNTDRITRVGTWLRRFRFDELPQFLNVLRGDMNLVGPRPHPVTNYSLFLSQIPYYRIRGAVRPGITGWAQIRYGYANTLEEETEKMRYDLYYIKHRSLGLDVQILLQTVGVLLLDRRSHEAVRTSAVAAEAERRALAERRATVRTA